MATPDALFTLFGMLILLLIHLKSETYCVSAPEIQLLSDSSFVGSTDLSRSRSFSLSLSLSLSLSNEMLRTHLIVRL